MGDEEPHALVDNLNCSGAVHVGETALKKQLQYKTLTKQKRLLAQKSAKKKKKRKKRKTPKTARKRMFSCRVE